MLYEQSNRKISLSRQLMMNIGKNTPTVIDEFNSDEFKRLQRLTPQRLDRLEQDTALISRSVAQTGLVTNSTIAQLDRRSETTQRRLSARVENALVIGAGLLTMAVTYWATDFLLWRFLHYLADRFGWSLT
ncbi:MAG: hypothetical protein CV045_01485 [Cyanobacteria bacterium M5B4]|nr:MAG: hypothetical protein CV045_01485 [Cyanobacteria bacterium M5B4]